MYNFSPYLASNMVSSQLPFSLPGVAAATTAAKTAKTFSFSSIFGGIGKTVNVVNQVVPLYQNIKPMISNSKTIFKLMKTLNSNTPLNTNIEQEIVKEEVKQPKIEATYEVKDEKVEIISEAEPAKPFFN